MRWRYGLTAAVLQVLVAVLLLSGVGALPAATADPGATLVRAEVFFHTNDDDKDDDTRVTVTVRDQENVEATSISGNFEHFDDNSDHGPYPMDLKHASTWDSLRFGSTTIVIGPNGNDTWKFNFKVTLTFSDGTHLATDAGGIEMSEQRTEKSWNVLPPLDGDYWRMDYSWVPQPRTVAESAQYLQARRIPSLLWEACVSAENSGRGEGYLSHVLAEASLLRLIEDRAGRAQLTAAMTGPRKIRDGKGIYQGCLDHLAPGWRTPGAGAKDELSTAPGWQKVIADMLKVPAFTGKPGTDTAPSCRTDGGPTDEWDFTMSLLLRTWGFVRQVPSKVLFGTDDPAKLAQLKKDISERVWLQGGKADIDATICVRLGIAVPETENHEWLIRTTRFLHNEMLDIVPVPSWEPKYVKEYNVDPNPDNNTNGIAGYIHGLTADLLKTDWLEYNSRPYSRYQLIGLLNLYEFSADPSIKQDAINLLNYMSVKHASETMDNKRDVPFRRKKDKSTDKFFQEDPTAAFYQSWVGGMSDLPFMPLNVSEEMSIAASSEYQPPTWATDQMLNRQHRDFLQFFNGRKQMEAAYGGPDFVISGGGADTDCPYPGGVVNACVGAGNDHGTVEPIVLLPHRAKDQTDAALADAWYPSYNDEIRIPGSKQNTCITRNFACGKDLAVPQAMKDNACTVKFDNPAGPDPVGDPQKRKAIAVSETVLRFDAKCGGPQYAQGCFFAYTANSAPMKYVVTHTCSPTAPAAETDKAYDAFIRYMRTTGRPLYTNFACGAPGSGMFAELLDLVVPPADVIDLSAMPPGQPVNAVYNRRCGLDTPVWDVGGHDDSVMHGDLTVNGGRYPTTTTTLSTTADHRSPAGQAVSLTAAVSAPGRSGFTGTVTFLEGGTVLGTAPVSGGQAKLTLDSLSLGNHRLSAVYSGDLTFVASVGKADHAVFGTLDRAQALIAEAQKLWGQGARPQAADRAAMAVSIVRELAKETPAHRRLQAEWSIYPASAFLAGTGRFDEATVLGEEGIALYRQLSKESPADDDLAYRVGWASTTLAGSLWNKPELRQKAAGLAVDGATAIRALATRNTVYRRQLADVTAYPASPFAGALGRFDEATTLGEESIALYRQLSKEKPSDDELAHRVAWASITLAGTLWNKPELRQKAAGLAADGVAAVRPVAARTPAYRRQLADWTAYPASPFLAAVGRFDEASALGEESIALFKQLSKENPADDEVAYRIGWASVTLAGTLWNKPELRQKAADLAAAGVDAVRPVAARNPAYRRSLADYAAYPGSTFAGAVGRFDKATAMGEEAIAVYEKLSKENPADDEVGYRVGWASVTLANTLWTKPELHQKAADLAAKGVTGLRPVAARNPAYRAQLGDWILAPAIPYLVGVGQKTQAIPLAQEAVDLFTALNQADPATYGPKLAQAKQKLAELQQ